MKYGEAFHEASVPQWATYNIEYDELKHLIKRNTSRDQGQAVAIPGYDDLALQKFENLFYAELCNQHDRVDLFVKSKAHEFDVRLRDYKKKTVKLVAQCNFASAASDTGTISLRRQERLSRLESRILRCGEDIRNLDRFIDAQRTAFRKILKKYKKWTGSSSLNNRFTDNVLSNPKSFTRRDLEPLYEQYNELLNKLREVSPSQSQTSSPVIQSRRQSRISRLSSRIESPRQSVVSIPRQQYWNEYDDGSERDPDEPYLIYIDPDASSPSFPGADLAAHVFAYLSNGAKVPIGKIQAWFSPNESPPLPPEERRPLIGEDEEAGYAAGHSRNNSSVNTESDEDDVSSTGEFHFPTKGYVTHYATFPSVSEQRFTQHQDRLLFRTTIGCFTASYLLLLIAGILVATGRHRLRIEVDAGVIAGVVGSLFFGTIGFTVLLYRWDRASFAYKVLSAISFLADCVISGILLVLVMGGAKLP